MVFHKRLGKIWIHCTLEYRIIGGRLGIIRGNFIHILISGFGIIGGGGKIKKNENILKKLIFSDY